MGAHSAYAPKAERTLKRRVKPLLTQVQAACRLMILTGARLTEQELHLMLKLYYHVGVMRNAGDVSNALSSIGLNVALDDLNCYLSRVNFEPGAILDWTQFAKLARYVKSRFLMEAVIPDSQVAFVALGGESNLSGDIETDRLRFICQSEFRLTLDIDAFIAEHDEDGSGKLNFSEFSAMFHEEEDGGHGRADGNGNSVALSASAKPQDGGANGDDAAGGGGPVADGDAAGGAPGGANPSADVSKSNNPAADPGEMQPQAVFDACQQWADNDPLHTPSTRRGHRSKTGKPGAANSNNGDSATEPSSPVDVGNAKPSSPPKKERKPLWIKGDEEDGKLRRAQVCRPGEAADTSFGSSKRFGTDRPFEPLPPPRGTKNTAQIHRPHFRDGPPLPLSARGTQDRNAPPLILPRISSRGGGAESSLTARRWFEVDPFSNPAETDLGADLETRDREAAAQRRPLQARMGRSNVLCQPEMSF